MLANRGAKNGEGARGVNSHPSGEEPHVNTAVWTAAGDNLAFGRVEFQSDLSGGRPKTSKACSDLPVVSSKAHIIKESKHQRRWGGPRFSSLQRRLEGQSKKERAKRISLLDTSF